MSVTYPADPAKPYGDRIETPGADLTHDEPFVPVYARRGKARGGQGKIKTWMILAPVAVLAMGGIGVMMAMNGGDEAAAPLVEPAATLPVLPTAPVAIEPAAAPLTSTAAPAPVVAAPPVAREAAPLRRVAPAPARRAAAPAPAPVATPRVQTPAPAVATGPQPYAPAPAGPSTTTLNTAPATPAPTPAPTPPVIVVEPVG